MSKLDSIRVPIFASDSPGYDADFCAWSEEQARRLRALQIPGLDIENIAEEIESLSRSDKREVGNRLAVLLAHLLKWQAQPMARSSGWRGTIREQRRRLASLLDESPSLRPTVADIITRRYPEAVEAACYETGLSMQAFPQTCHWSPEQVLELDFFPGSQDAGVAP